MNINNLGEELKIDNCSICHKASPKDAFVLEYGRTNYVTLKKQYHKTFLMRNRYFFQMRFGSKIKDRLSI